MIDNNIMWKSDLKIYGTLVREAQILSLIYYLSILINNKLMIDNNILGKSVVFWFENLVPWWKLGHYLPCHDGRSRVIEFAIC